MATTDTAQELKEKTEENAVPSLVAPPLLAPPVAPAPKSVMPPEFNKPSTETRISVNEDVEPGFQFLTYTDMDGVITDNFYSKNENHSTICDIMAMYLKGQKILYTESKTLCEQRLNYLMLPAIFITAVCTILSLVLKSYDYGATIVSSLNGFNVFLLAVINYLKLDAKAEAHRTSAYKFDKLQSNMEFNSGKILFINADSRELQRIITETENNVREIKETNQFILPERIRYKYPKLFTTNIFAEFKKIHTTETLLTNRLKDICNELRLLRFRVNRKKQEDAAAAAAATQTPADQTRQEELETLQKDTMNAIIAIKDKYLDIDDMFELEVEQQRIKDARRISLCDWLKT